MRLLVYHTELTAEDAVELAKCCAQFYVLELKGSETTFH